MAVVMPGGGGEAATDRAVPARPESSRRKNGRFGTGRSRKIQGGWMPGLSGWAVRLLI